MNLNGTIKKTQALSGRLVKSSGGGGSVQEIYWVQFGVGTATNAEVNEAVAANKLPICYWDSTDAYGRPRRTLYFLIRNTPTESFFSGVDYINNTIIVRRLYADAWDTQTIRYEGKLTWDTTPRFGSANPVTSGGIYNAIQNATVSDERIAEAVDDWLSVQAPSIGTLSYAAKQALLACFRHVAWIDDQGQSYYNALESELFPDATLESITALFSQGSATIYDTDSLDTLKQYLVVTATYSDSTTATVTDYTLSGTLAEGTSTITVSYGGKTDTFDVTVTERAGILGYVADGLLMLLDGIANGENGTHNTNISTLYDQSGNGYNWVSGAGSVTATDKALVFDGSSNLAGASTWKQNALTVPKTVEVVLSVTSPATTACVMSGLSVAQGIRNTTGYGAVGVKSSQLLHYTGSSYGCIPITSGVHTYTFINDNGTWIGYKDGVRVSFDSTAVSWKSGYKRLGSFEGQDGGNLNNYFTGSLYSYRYYTEALSAEEVSANYSNDVARFGLGG